MRYAVPRLLAALLLAGVGILPAAGPAGASVCSSTSDGVTVVVDFHELGGGVQSVCDPDGGGKTAAALFPANGFPLDYVQRQPGFVCRVSGKPADDPCVNTPPADAYWGLFWSNGQTGQWSYATSGAGSQKIPAGGSVAFSWQASSSRTEPGVAPPKHASQPSSPPSSSPTGKPSGGGSTGGGGSGAAPSSATAPASSAAASAPADSPSSAGRRRHGQKSRDHQKAAPRKHQDGKPTSTPSPSAETSAAAPAAEDVPRVPQPAVPDDSDGLPTWVPLGAIGLLFATAIGIGVVQRRRS